MKIILSGVVAGLFILLLNLMQVWYASNPLLAGASKNLIKTTRLPDRKEKSAGSELALWPQFPGSARSTVHRMTLNGVATISEDWQTSAAAVDVIAYYKEQMLARGWREVTEETYQLQPESRGAGMDNHGLQNPKYVEKYVAMMNTSLVLNRAPWSLQILTAPSEKGIRQTAVRVFAAATPSIKEFCLSIGEEAFKADNVGSANGAIDTVQESGGQRCHTTLAIKNEEPGQIFNEMLKEYHGKNWRCLTFHSASQGRPSYFAWLVNGQSYAALSVRALPKGNSSSVTFTEVTPE